MSDLTKAQRALLLNASALSGEYCVKAYKPARALVSLGLAEWHLDDAYGGWLRLTDAGRSRLARVPAVPSTVRRVGS
jgi:hypothetical protein